MDVNNLSTENQIDGMVELGERNYLLIKNAIKDAGSYEPDDVLAACAEELYTHEIEPIRLFLTWVSEDSGRAFGSTNYEERFQQWKLTIPLTTPE